MRPIADVLSRARSTWFVLVALDLVAVVGASLLVLSPAERGPVPLAGAAALLVCRGAGLYRRRLVLSVLDDLAPLALAAAVAGLTVLGVGLDELGDEPVEEAARFGVATFALAVGLRTLAHATTRLLRASGRLSRPAIVVGAGSTGRRIAETLLARRELGLRPVGIIDGGHGDSLRGLPLPLLGQVHDLDHLVVDLGVRDLVFACPDAPDAETVEAVRSCLRRGRQVYVVPRFFELSGADLGHQVEQVRDVALMRLSPRPGRGPGAVGRVVDVVVAAAALAVLLPLLLVVAVAVRLETRASVLVRRPVASTDGRPPGALRFRTLRPAVFGDDATSWSLDHDRRTGPVGRLLRRTALDELPQLLDVVRGERHLLGGRHGARQGGSVESMVPPGPGLPQAPATDDEGWAWLAPEPIETSGPRTATGTTTAQRRAATSRR